MKLHYPKWMSTAIACLVTMLAVAPVMAQDYGVGETRIVPQAIDSIVIDGVYEADTWDTGVLLDLEANTSYWSEDFQDDVEEAWARVLFGPDTVYIYVSITDPEVYTAENVWESDQIVIGFDPVHEAGVTDQFVDTDDWAGWPENAPADGPYAYKIYPDGAGGAFTLNWGFNDVDPVAEGWVDGVTYVNEEEGSWGIEAAFYVPGVERGAQIGFNIGGATANAEACDVLGECAYGFFSHWSVENPGGDINSQSASYGTLQMGAGGGEGYGGGVVVDVPRVDAGAITIDGVADEEAWGMAFDDIDFAANWNYYGDLAEEPAGPDIYGETMLLWSEGTLYVYHHRYDVDIFWGGDTGSFWNSDMALVGFDPSAEGDTLFGPNFDGGIENAPDGPHTYFINDPAGFTIGWNEEISPADTGWVEAEFFVDEELLEWGFEAAFHFPQIEEGGEMGFDIGGAQATMEQCEATEFSYCDYAYFAWQTGAGGTDPGTINRDASQWALLNFVTGTAIERTPEVPGAFTLGQNFPNPFNPSTTIEFGLQRTAKVNVSVFNTLGQRVAILADGVQQAGTYHVDWDASSVPSGVYMYQLEVDGQVIDSKKMVLMK